MNKFLKPARDGVRKIARDVAYRPRSRELARKIVQDSSGSRIREYVESHGHGAALRRIASESLPEHTYFAKLTIDDWQKYRGKRFRVIQDGTVVYGNEIEPPARGFPLEYRNFIVSSDDPSRFALDIDASFSMKIGRGAFSTAEQVRYDEKYGVQQHGDVFYSLRGNTTDPSRIFVTFPGFGPSTSRISYAVSYLKDITDADLEDSLMVCFQDRYMAAGTYMLVDNAGVSLRDRVRDALQKILDTYSLRPEQMLFFGASKGGSIAVLHAQSFPDAQLLLVVPQMNLPYYLDKPFFRDSLFRLDAVWDSPQPGDLLRQYFTEQRSIDYFYADDDEQSNFSLIEFARDIPNLRKYRVDGKHSDVAKKALPMILAIIRAFLRGEATPASTPVTCDQGVAFPAGEREHGTGIQLRLSNDASVGRGANTNVFVRGRLGATTAHHLIGPHTYDFIRYTNPQQRLSPSLHDPEQLDEIVVADPSHGIRTGQLGLIGTDATPSTGSVTPHLVDPIDLSPGSEDRTYAILHSPTRPVSLFEYRVAPGSEGGEFDLCIEFIADLRSDADHTAPGTSPVTVTARAEEPIDALDLFVHRLALAARAERVRVVLSDPEIPQSQATALKRLYGPAVEVVDERPELFVGQVPVHPAGGPR